MIKYFDKYHPGAFIDYLNGKSKKTNDIVVMSSGAFLNIDYTKEIPRLINNKDIFDNICMNIHKTMDRSYGIEHPRIQDEQILFLIERLNCENDVENQNKLIKYIDNILCSQIESHNCSVDINDQKIFLNQCNKTGKVKELPGYFNLITKLSKQKNPVPRRDEFDIKMLLELYRILILNQKVEDISTILRSWSEYRNYNQELSISEILLFNFLERATDQEMITFRSSIEKLYCERRETTIALFVRIHEQTKKRFDWFEKMMLNNGIICGRDNYILSMYVQYTQKVVGKKWPEIEPIIGQSVRALYDYAEALKCDISYKDGENRVLKNSNYSKEYIDILKKCLNETQMKEKIASNSNLMACLL